MNGTILLLAIIGHLVGDYLLQNDWMALNKKKASFHCVIHCWIWTISVMLFSGWQTLPPSRALPIFFVLFLTHFFQDRTDIVSRWMDFIGQKQFRTGICFPWSVIVVDNVWHIVTLWMVWRFL